MNAQDLLMKEALHKAWLGEEYGDIVGKLEPEHQKRLKCHILDMPEEVAIKTIYGAVAWRERVNVPRGRGRPRKS
jgi:hypothetical protein